MRWITFALVIAISLSGCASEETTPEPNTGSETAEQPTNQTVEMANNTAPVASLAATAMNGTAPLFVDFTLNGTDADGDNLTWILSINGNETANGTSLPAMANATLDVGNHTILFTVFDGNLSSEANLTISVVAAAVEEVDPNAPIDMGWYWFDPVTSLCNVKTFTTYGGSVYVSTLSGGTWVIAESNGEPGLQIADDHPTTGTGGGFEIDAPGCIDGDLILV